MQSNRGSADEITPQGIMQIYWGVRAEPTWILSELLLRLRKKLVKRSEQSSASLSKLFPSLMPRYLREVDHFLTFFTNSKNAIPALIHYLNHKLIADGELKFETPCMQLLKSYFSLQPVFRAYMSDELAICFSINDFWQREIWSKLQTVISELNSTANDDRKREIFQFLSAIEPYLSQSWREVIIFQLGNLLVRRLSSVGLYETLYIYKEHLSDKMSRLLVEIIFDHIWMFDAVTVAGLKIVDALFNKLDVYDQGQLVPSILYYLNDGFLSEKYFDVLCSLLVKCFSGCQDDAKYDDYRERLIALLSRYIEIHADNESLLTTLRDTMYVCMTEVERVTHSEKYVSQLLLEAVPSVFADQLALGVLYEADLSMHLQKSGLIEEICNKILSIISDPKLSASVKLAIKIRMLDLPDLFEPDMLESIILSALPLTYSIADPLEISSQEKHMAFIFDAMQKIKNKISLTATGIFINELYNTILNDAVPAYLKIKALNLVGELQQASMLFGEAYYLALVNVIQNSKLDELLRKQAINILTQAIEFADKKCLEQAISFFNAMLIDSRANQAVRLEVASSLARLQRFCSADQKAAIADYFIHRLKSYTKVHKILFLNILLYELHDYLPHNLRLEVCDALVNCMLRHPTKLLNKMLPTLRAYCVDFNIDQQWVLLCKFNTVANTNNLETMVTLMALFHGYQENLTSHLLNRVFQHYQTAVPSITKDILSMRRA